MSLVIRPGRVEDYPLFASLFTELGVPEPPPPATRFEAMLPCVLIATEGDEGLGYAFWQVYGELAHIVNVVVAEGARGRGVGRALMEGVGSACRHEGCARWYLNVKQDNLPAIALYRRAGLLPDGEVWTMRLPWSVVTELPAEAEAPTAYTPGPEEDVALSSWPGLPVARLGVLRARPGIVLRAIREGSASCGFAAFDPLVPGINPLRVARPTLLRPLLESLRTVAEGHEHVVVVVEGDAVTMEAVRSAGGKLLFALLRMAAPLEPLGAGP